MNKPKVVLGNGNAYVIMGRVASALQRAGQGDKIDAYYAEATAGDYDNLLRVTMEYVDVSLENDSEYDDDDDCEECYYEED